MINFYNEFLVEIDNIHIKQSEVCLVGSTVLSLNNLRNNNDLEFIINKNEIEINKHFYRKYNKWDKIMINNDIDLFFNICSLCGFTDQTIFNNKLYEYYNDTPVLCIELEYLYKKQLCKLLKREKDYNDIELIEKAFPNISYDSKQIYKKYGSWYIKFFSCIKFKMHKVKDIIYDFINNLY